MEETTCKIKHIFGGVLLLVLVNKLNFFNFFIEKLSLIRVLSSEIMNQNLVHIGINLVLIIGNTNSW